MDHQKLSTCDDSKVELELTNKYLRGEISFAEYSNEWCGSEEEDDDESSNAIIEVCSESQSSLQAHGNKITRRRRYTRLSPALMGLMGEANLRFARGEKEVAEKMCHEIIKQAPMASEPYQTLAQIYDNDPEKSLQFSLLAAHLCPTDSQKWLQLAANSKKRNDIKQEMICYTHAIRAEPHNLDIHLKRIEFLKSLENTSPPLSSVLRVSLVKCYHRIVICLPDSEGETIMKYARMAAAIYKQNDDPDKTLDVMKAAYKKCPNLFNFGDINILIELLITHKYYQTCIEILVASTGVEVEAEVETIRNSENEIEEKYNYLDCKIPDNLPIDLKTKLIVCFVHLGAMNLVEVLLKDFLKDGVKNAGDLYLDIEEALSAAGQHNMALDVLQPLISDSSFDLGAVWLKHADCLQKLGRDDESIESYHNVLKHGPTYVEARRKLFNILEKKGRIEDALQILQQDYKGVVNTELLYEQCSLLKKYNKLLKYLEIGEDLLSKSFTKYRYEDELKVAHRLRGSVDQIQSLRLARGEEVYDENHIHFDEKETFKLSSEQEWLLLKDLLQVAFKNKQYITMQRLVFGSLTSKNLLPYRQDIEFYCFQSCLLNKDYTRAFKYARDILFKQPTVKAWNLLNLSMILSDKNCTYNKFLVRLYQKERSYINNLFLGFNFLTSGRYVLALKHLLEYHDQKQEALLSLMIGVIHLAMAAQRTVDKHHDMFLQGMTYLFSYRDVRKCDQEAYYNIGRAYQMLSIPNLAIEYYEKALSCGPIATCEEHGVIDLSPEIAHNLIILYKDHSPQMALKYMSKYLVI